MQKNGSILVVFGEELPKGGLNQYDTVLSGAELQKLIEPGSIYEASAFTEKLSHLKLPNGVSLPKSFIYQGYELWWMYYYSLFYYFSLPYIQHKRLLEYLKGFQNIYFYRPPYKSLFSYYLEAHGCKVDTLREPGFKSPSFLPFGIFVQILITCLSIPILMIRKQSRMIFVGDKFEKDKDYDFRMRYIYQELRQRKLGFVEFIRSLESWKAVLQHALIRRRPVIYSEAVAFIGKFFSVFSSRPNLSISEQDPEALFKLLVATHYIKNVYDDIWAIRIMRWILSMAGIKAAFIAAANERNFHAVLGCKLNNIPTVGILHGVASRYYNGYDFLPGFSGEKMLSVDKYGLWSEWWKEYYVKYSDAYKPEQLYVSGPMRPLEKSTDNRRPTTNNTGPVKVLFVSEQPALPLEVMPYLETLLDRPDVELSMTFRQYRDAFKDWLVEHRPDFLKRDDIKIVEGGLQEAIGASEVVVGAHSTVVLEGLFQLKVPLFFKTEKWGDYFDLKDYDKEHSFFAENPDEFIKKIKNVRTVSVDILKDLQKRYFGDPYKNGSKWVVDELEEYLK